MILGLRAAIYPTPDIARGKRWYADVLDREPYFDQPFYVGFEVGGFELGLIPDATPAADGTHIHWGVPDIEAELARLIALGAKPHEEIKAVGEGIRIASVLDPFGNVFALIENLQFDASKLR